MTRFAAILLALCIGITTTPSSFAADNLDSNRLQAARRLVMTLGIAELFVDGAKRGFSKTAMQEPSRARELTWVLGLW